MQVSPSRTANAVRSPTVTEAPSATVPVTNPATTFFVIIVPTPPGLGSVWRWDTRRAPNGTVVIVTASADVRDYSGAVL